jgi:hypothetical protein
MELVWDSGRGLVSASKRERWRFRFAKCEIGCLLFKELEADCHSLGGHWVHLGLTVLGGKQELNHELERGGDGPKAA